MPNKAPKSPAPVNPMSPLVAVYALLERPRIARRAVALLLVIHSCLLGYSAYVHSPTLNEPAHLVAGISHWKFGRFDIYNVNPPLVKLVAALPVMAVGYNEDWRGFSKGPGVRPERIMGEDVIKAKYVSQLFTGSADNSATSTRGPESTNLPTFNNRFKKSWFRGVPVPFSKNYQKRVHAHRRGF